MADLKAQVELLLHDLFSKGIQKAEANADKFGGTVAGAAQKADRAMSGLHMTLATVGVGLGTAALVKGSIDYQNAITRIATNAGVYGREVNEFGRTLTQIAYNAKIPREELVSFAGVLADNAVGMEDITANAAFMADVIQGLSVSGTEAGQIFTTLFKRGVDSNTLKEKLNNLVVIGDRLGNIPLPQFAKFLPQLSETSGVTVDNIEDLYIAVSMLATGTNKPAQAIGQYAAAMKDFADSKTRDAMRRYLNFDTVDKTTGELKSFAEIMEALNQFAETKGSTNNFDKAFHLSDLTIKALRQYNGHYGETIKKVGELGDTTNAIADKAGQNAGTIAGSLNRLKSAAADFADSRLIQPVEWLADMLDKHPRGMEYAVKGLAAAVATLAGMKAFSTVASFIKSLKGTKGSASPLGGMPGGAGIPVYVTNWGGGIPANGSPSIPKTIQPPLGKDGKPLANIKPVQLAGAATVAGVGAAIVKVPQMMNELESIKQNEELTAKERGKAKGGAIGDATGSIVGSAGGAAAGTVLGAIAGGAIAGTAIGTAVPGLGNIAGLVIGAGIGLAGYYLGGKAGRAIGGGIGGALGDDSKVSPYVYQVDSLDMEALRFADHYIPVSALPPQMTQDRPPIEPQKVELDGQAVMDVNLNLSGITPTASVAIRSNTTPIVFNPGSVVQARMIP